MSYSTQYFPNNKRWEGVIFDLDGTLLDSMGAWDIIALEYLESMDIFPKEDWRDVIKTMNLLQVAQYFRHEYGVPRSVPRLIADTTRMGKRYYRSVELKEGARELLETFDDAGLSLCVATANDRRISKRILRKKGLLNYFSFVLTCGEAKVGKDQPDFYEYALKRLGTKKEKTLVFEDALHAVRTAKQAGFTVVGVYDPSAENDRKEIEEIADYYIESLRDWKNMPGIMTRQCPALGDCSGAMGIQTDL